MTVKIITKDEVGFMEISSLRAHPKRITIVSNEGEIKMFNPEENVLRVILYDFGVMRTRWDVDKETQTFKEF